ncbi:ABC transporter ATP-binding protein [Apilactobacillus sp. TMW 2.2459]|uniref:ABC transporter ATP-binding protein n=1 Tax=Apilactobacillus xinyiensis TaxID=2841032 RepID=UPI00200C1DA8|nr:ABC transporter ATP-binding protein [Apilactobacillus xinyiensis]MCL0312452.1 ABC transporter ATP-binding protein [Apilactobacillus xinyiensis]
MENKSIIEFRNVTFQYNSQSEPTLKNINLNIKSGEKVLIVGPSGSGKSTLGNLINGIIPRNVKGSLQGDILIDGKNIQSMSLFDLSLKVGTLLQNSNDQFVGLTVAEDIAFGMENDCVNNAEMKTKVNQWADYLDIKNLLQQAPNQLSGGQKQRTGLAGIMVDEAPILLLDEPLAALDPAAGFSSIKLVDDIHQQLHNTVLIIEHRIEEVLNQSVDKVILMNDGEIVGIFKPDNLLKENILQKYGLRNPLYLDLLKSAGVDIQKLEHIASASLVNGNGMLPKLQLANQQRIPNAIKNDQNPILKIQHLNFSYNQKTIFKNLNLSVNHGDMLALVGKNGVGKSTLSKLIAGFIKPHSGSIFLNGDSLDGVTIKERADKIGYIMQDPDKMISKVMIKDEIALGLQLRGFDADYIDQKVTEVLKVCHLYEFRNWPISALSYGQKKRLTIASILALDPQLLILDEPTAGQDYYHYTEIMQFLQDLNQKHHITMIFVTHDMYLMTEYANRAVVLGNYGILKDDYPEAILDDDEIVLAAHLKSTSISTLARRFNLSADRLTHYLISKESNNKHE